MVSIQEAFVKDETIMQLLQMEALKRGCATPHLKVLKRGVLDPI